MPDEAVICQFVYTPKEFKQAFRAGVGRRRTRRIVFGILFALIAYNLWDTYSNFGDPAEWSDAVPYAYTTTLLWSMFYNVLPIIVVFILVSCWVVFASRRAFRKGLYLNQEVTYCLDENGHQVSQLTHWDGHALGSRQPF